MPKFKKGDIVSITNDVDNSGTFYSKWIGQPLIVVRVGSDVTYYDLPDGRPGGCFTFRLEFYKINLENE